MRPLNNELESCWCQNWQCPQKLSFVRNLRGNAFKGDILWQLWFFNKVGWFIFIYIWPPFKVCPPKWRPKLLFACFVKRLTVTLRCAVNVTTSSFQHFPWSLSAKLLMACSVWQFTELRLVWYGVYATLLNKENSKFSCMFRFDLVCWADGKTV